MSVAAKLNSQPHIKLVVQKGPHMGQRFAFSKSKITIGRSPENDIILVNDPLISRQHAYIQISQNDVEIVNLSEKNPILINNENVNRWKLAHGTAFTIGETEFLIQIENQQSVVVMKPTVAELPLQPIKPAKNKLNAAPPSQKAPSPQAFSASPQYHQTISAPKRKPPEKTIFYIVLAIVIGAGLYFFLSSGAGSGTKKNKKPSTLKYSDETAIRLNSQEMTDSFSKLEKSAKLKQSSTYLRAEENFSKGMRSFQQGNYANSIELFQVTLTANSEHVLAKRYLYLSKVRFDEIVKAKLVLGQSYFERNNFKLCKSMFQQVIDMLSPKEMLQAQSKDTNLQLARTMLKKCEFAAEGIH